MTSKFVQAQIRYLDLLKKYNLLDLKLAGKLPPEVDQAARQAVVLEFAGEQTNESKTILHCSAQEHTEAEREIDEYLRHYKLERDLRRELKKSLPRTFIKGAKYKVRTGYFEGRLVTYKGTDREIFGCEWIDSFGHPACEKYLFRAQRDRLNPNRQALIFSLDGENRDIILQESELEREVLYGRTT